MALKTTELLDKLEMVERAGTGTSYTPENYPPVTEQERRCAQDLLTILTHMKRVIAHNREGSGFPITMQQYLVLKILKQQEYLISELADMFRVSRPTMSRIIDGLEGRRRAGNNDETGEQANTQNNHHKEKRAKLVERVDSLDDRRLVYARITPDGLEMLDYYCNKSEESVTSVLRRINPAEMTHLERALEVLRKALEAEA